MTTKTKALIGLGFSGSPRWFRPETIETSSASRIGFIPKVVAAARESLKNPPKQFTETAIKQNKGAIAFYESGIFVISVTRFAISLFR